MKDLAPGGDLVLFDGLCRLCSSSVAFILRRDKKKRYSFLALQSEKARQILVSLSFPPGMPGTLILITGEKVYYRSDAVLRILKNLHALWPLLYVFILVPRCMRDPVYDCIARKREDWFGRHDQCWMPSEEDKNRFLQTGPVISSTDPNCN